MKIFQTFVIILILIFNVSCSNNIQKKSQLTEKNLELQVLEAYKEGLKSLEEGDIFFAVKKFNEVETLFPQSEWAPKSALMAAYAYYSQDYYGDVIIELERFLKIYPLNKNLDYAYYLLAITYYEQIVDEKKDLQSILNSKKNFEYLIKNYPNTKYALDAEFKLNLIQDILASKEMYIGRYYFDKKKWIPAINRFKIVLDEFETTIFVEEALHRLVEIHYTIGLNDEAIKYAAILGYNYQSSEWYERSYKIFNEMYELRLNERKIYNKNVLKKIKSLLD